MRKFKFKKGDKVVLAHDAEFIHNGKKLPHNTEFTVVSVDEDMWGMGEFCYELDNGAIIMPYWEDSFEKAGRGAEKKPMQKTPTVPGSTVTVMVDLASHVTTARRTYANDDIICCAACGSDDQYDEALGACIAVARTYKRTDIEKALCSLIKKREKPKGYTGKVVCTNTGFGSPFTVGRIYDVNDGKIAITGKDGGTHAYDYPNRHAEFLKIVE